MSINEWCSSHKDVIVSIVNPRSETDYKTDIWMENSGYSKNVFREIVGKEPATEDEIVDILDEMYLELKENSND